MTGDSGDSDDSTQSDDVFHYKAVVCTGRQPDSDVFILILGPSLQFTIHGNEIPVDRQEYVWVPEILDKLVSGRVHCEPTELCCQRPGSNSWRKCHQ